MNIFKMNGSIIRGRRIDIRNDQVFIDGKNVSREVGKPANGILEIRVLEGVIEELKTDASVVCGEVRGSLEAGGSISARSVAGNASAGGAVNCKDVGGNVSAGGSVTCDAVGGNISAGGSVRHR